MSSEVVHHVGKITNTDRRCVIVYPQNPHDPSMALIVDTDALPPRLHDAVMEIVTGRDAQSTPALANVLQRRVFSDTGVDLMNTLFQRGHLQAVPIESVTLYPRPNNPVPLSMVVNNSSHRSMDSDAVAQTPSMERSAYHERLTEMDPNHYAKHNPYVENQRYERSEEMVGTARGLLSEADMLEQEAAGKRRRAYEMAPSLRRPVDTEAAVVEEIGEEGADLSLSEETELDKNRPTE